MGILTTYDFPLISNRFPFSESKTQSAVFLHMLTCIWVLMQQLPYYFEFNEELLLFLFDSLHDCR